MLILFSVLLEHLLNVNRNKTEKCVLFWFLILICYSYCLGWKNRGSD